MGFPGGNFTITNEETGRVLCTIRGSGEGVILVGSAAVPQDVWFVEKGKLISLYIEKQRNIGTYALSAQTGAGMTGVYRPPTYDEALRYAEYHPPQGWRGDRRDWAQVFAEFLSATSARQREIADHVPQEYAGGLPWSTALYRAAEGARVPEGCMITVDGATNDNAGNQIWVTQDGYIFDRDKQFYFSDYEGKPYGLSRGRPAQKWRFTPA
ncbi:hypothetical protein ACLMAJ_10970 [Nocardia sp. KC 131]|uniref:hypothetical protein n=1 Tax=Nocardia arseniciresistens TaxID=3392119 RepID=UPI00398F8A5C